MDSRVFVGEDGFGDGWEMFLEGGVEFLIG